VEGTFDVLLHVTFKAAVLTTSKIEDESLLTRERGDENTKIRTAQESNWGTIVLTGWDYGFLSSP
jgi:hypothetical protein